MCHFEKKSQAFFNILTEPLLVQKQTIHQQKAWDLSYLEPDRKGRGILLTVPHPLSGPQTKAEIQGFLLMYRLFLY